MVTGYNNQILTGVEVDIQGYSCDLNTSQYLVEIANSWWLIKRF